MELTRYQPPEIYGDDGELIRSGSWGPGLPLFSEDGKALYDYIANNFEALQNGVGGAADSASTATTQAALAVAKTNEALSAQEATEAALEQALAAQTAAEAAKVAAQAAASQAAEISTPEGLAARVVALENQPHFYYNNEGHLMFCYGF